ncbi:hypothetical protein HpMS158_13840 [Helicobacter pylori]
MRQKHETATSNQLKEITQIMQVRQKRSVQTSENANTRGQK